MQPNGLVFDEVNNILYVAFNIADKISVIDLISRSIIHTVHVNGPDNLVLDEGVLWITSLDHQLLDALDCEDLSPCALPFSVSALDASNLELIERWEFKQQTFGLPSVALPVKSETLNQVFIGTFNGDRLAYFDRDIKTDPDVGKILIRDDVVDVAPAIDVSSE